MSINKFARLVQTAASVIVASFIWGAKAQADDFKSPDIVVLGDSQLSFGSGPVFLDFFENIDQHCAPSPAQAMAFDRLGDRRVAVFGVRSTSIGTWTGRSRRAKSAVCDVDPKWKANAATFGTVNTTKNKYVQIGRGKNYQFCEKGQSPFEAMFADDYYTPELVVMSFLGNSAKRWANDPEKALQDVQAMTEQLPRDVPCIFITSAPPYKSETVKLRLKAQQNLKQAFVQSGSHCSFVEGFTDETIAANQGNKAHFRRSKSGRVKDPFHPNDKAARNFIRVQTGAICEAVHAQLGSGAVQVSQNTQAPLLALQP